MRSGVLVLVAACYSPRPPSAVPCGDGDPRCPSGQICVNEYCYPPDQVPSDGDHDAPPDAPEIDGSPFADTDMDGIFDDTDNCRTKSNADQANEDKDTLGDICDPCPISMTNTDGDGDGVGDACDPHPNTIGDSIVLFEGFNKMPTGWFPSGNGTWSVANGALVVTVPPGAPASFSAPITPDSTGMLFTSATVVTVHQSAVEAVGVALPMGQNGFAGVLCEVYDDGSRRFGLFDIQTNNVFESTSKDWTANTAYDFRLRRTGDQFRCSLDGEIQEDNQSPNPLMPRVGVRTLSIDTTFAYLLYVDSP